MNSSIRVLHVDDEPDFGELTASFLEREDERFAVETVSDAREVRPFLDEGNYDCIVSDYDMPDLNGIELLETIRAEYPDLPFVLFTGKGSEAVASDAISAGVTDYLQKKGGVEQYELLANRIANAVEQARIEEELARQQTETERLQNLLEHALTATDTYVWEWDLKSDAVSWYPSVESLFGVPDVPGEMFDDFVERVHPDDREQVERTIREGIDAGDGFQVDCRVEVGDASPAWVRNRGEVLTDGGTEPVRAVGSVTDVTQQRDREEARRRAEQRYRRIAEQNLFGLYIVQDGVVEYANPKAASIFGYTPEEAMGKSVFELVVESEHDRVREKMRQREEGDVEELQYTVTGRRKDGTEFTFEVHGGVIDYGGEPALLGAIEDVTERTERERELRRERERFSTLFESFPEPTLTYDFVDGEPLARSVNQAFEDTFGVDATAIAGQSVNDLIVPPDELGKAKDIDTRTQAGEFVDEEVRRRTADGDRCFKFRDIPIPFEEGLDGFAVYIDVTEQKDRERTLTALHRAAREIGRADDPETVYETLVETAEHVLDFDLVVVDVERDGYLIQEAWKLDLVDGNYYEKTSLEDDDTFAIRAYNRQETILVDDLHETRTTPADTEYRSALTVPIGEFGTFQAVSTEVAAFEDSDREFAELLVDHARVKLTQLESRQELRERTVELERQNERLDEFTSVVSHDLRNPLNTLTLSLDLAERTDDAEHFERCYRAADRMDQLLEELLTLARQGEDVGELEPVVLADAVEEAWRTVETGDSRLVVETALTVEAFRGRLKQLLENLFRNAVEHGGENVTVTVAGFDDGSAGKLDEGGGFYVADDGPGIPVDEREQVFETGYSTAEDGTGFGLTIVREIADAHGWTVRISESEAGGTQFDITGIESGGVTGVESEDVTGVEPE